MSQQTDLFDDVSNPLDSVEDIMTAHDWTFDRMNDDELTVHISGKYGHYTMTFNWQEHYQALQFCCTADLTLSPARLNDATQAINTINSKLWLGHFDIPMQSDTPVEKHTPCFRHTSLFRGMNYGSGAEHMEDLIDIALAECERYYTTFELLSIHKKQSDQEFSLAMMDAEGEG